MTAKRDVPASPPATGKERICFHGCAEAINVSPSGVYLVCGPDCRRVPASPRDCFCGECAAVDRPCASCVAKGLGEFAAPVASGTPKEVAYQSVSLDEARKRLEEAVASVRAAEEAYERAKRITQKDLRFEVDV